MNELTIKQTIALLVRVYNYSIQVFYFFPDVIIVGSQKMDRADFNFLCSQEYIAEVKADSFGKYYKLSSKAEDYIYQTVSKHFANKRRVKAAANQYSLPLV